MFVTLSRRSLLTLLAQLALPGNDRSLIKPGGIVVAAEPDEVHYAGRRPGRMSPEVETKIAEMEAALRPTQAV